MSASDSSQDDLAEEFVGEKMDVAVKAVFIVIGSLEVISGVAGNCLLLTVLLTRRSLGVRSFHNLFIANLALADLLSLGYWMTFFVLDLILDYHPVWNKAHCVANGFVIAVCLAVSVLSLLSISLNRYLHVCHNHLYSRAFTKGRTVVCCVMLWGVGALLALPPLLGLGSYDYSSSTRICSFHRGHNDMYPKVIIAIFTVIPMCMVGYFNFAIFRYWKLTRLNLSVYSKRQHSHRWGKSQGGKMLNIWRCCRRKSPNMTEVEDTELEQNCSADEFRENEDNIFTDAEQSTSATADELNDEVNLRRGLQTDNTREKEEEDGEDTSEIGNADEIKDNWRVTSEQCLPGTKNKSREGHEQIQQRPIQDESRAVRRSEATDCQRHEGVLQQRNARRRKDLMREKAFVRSLCAVFLLMLFCFFPFGIAMTVDATHPLSSEVAIAANFALFFNCSVNWIVYGVLNRSFRKKYVNILRRIMGLCCRRLRPRFVGEDHLVTSRNNTVAGWVQNLHRNDHEPPVSRKRSVQVLVAETSV